MPSRWCGCCSSAVCTASDPGGGSAGTSTRTLPIAGSDRLGPDGRVPDHSTFTGNRPLGRLLRNRLSAMHGRLRDSDIMREVFGRTVEACSARGPADTAPVAVDGTHVGASASGSRHVKTVDDLLRMGGTRGKVKVDRITAPSPAAPPVGTADPVLTGRTARPPASGRLAGRSTNPPASGPRLVRKRVSPGGRRPSGFAPDASSHISGTPTACIASDRGDCAGPPSRSPSPPQPGTRSRRRRSRPHRPRPRSCTA